jgi:hypothetical protein
MVVWAVLCWVGDDDSGPVDFKDDVDLECETVKTITLNLVFTFKEPAYLLGFPLMVS